MEKWRNGGRSHRKYDKNIRMTRADAESTLPMLGPGFNDEEEDLWMRPALRFEIVKQRKTDRCIFIMTLVSLLLVVMFSVLIVLLMSRQYVRACPECDAILNSMDQSIDPCHDFYQYSCGGWEDSVQIPEGHSKWGSFSQLYSQNHALLRKLLEKDGYTYKGEECEALRKAKDYYWACMNETAIELAGSQPLKKLLNQLGGWGIVPDTPGLDKWDESLFDLTNAIIATHKLDANPLFNMYLAPDEKNSSINVIHFYQHGIGMAAEELYSDNDTTHEDAYVALGAKVVVLLSLADNESTDLDSLSKHPNYAPAAQRMREIIDFEANMSDIYATKTDLQDPEKTYHKMKLQTFADMIPQINFSLYVNEIFAEDVPMDQDILVPTYSYFTQLNGLIEETPNSLLADYLTWNAIKPMLKYLSDAYHQVILEYDTVFSGSNTSLLLWEKCTGRTDLAFGFVTGALFVDEVVSPQLKNETEDLIQYLRHAFISNLPNVTWMDNITREAAEDKALFVKEKIGFPQWIENPAELDKYYAVANISASHSFENALNLKDYSLQWMRNHLGKPVDKSEWDMTPAEVNAYYSSSFNQIVFPSGILLPPFYDIRHPMSMNFGAIGMVMGHELTHGFDNHGRKFDKDGNMRDWWGDASAVAYENKTECMVNQYDNYKVGDISLNGEFTLSENIADNGGLKIAYNAYQVWKASNVETRYLSNLTFTDDQLFFLGFSQVWCTFSTPEYAHMSVYTDPHSYEKFRVNGAISNMEEFSSAYNCPVGTPMNPEKKCRVW